MESLDTDIDDKITRMESQIKDMYTKMYRMGAGTKARDDAWKVIKNFEKDLEQLKKQK